MQHPVGYHYNPLTHREELTSFLAVMANPEQLGTFPHTIAACFLVAGGLVTGIAARHLLRRPATDEKAAETTAAFRSASFSLFTIGTLNGSKPAFEITVPRVLSFLATGNFSGQVKGIDNIQSLYAQVYGPGSYTPVIPVTYWSFRLMIGLGLLAALIALIVLWAAIAMPFLPLAAMSVGWIFTEMSRQPWLVFGQMKTSAGVSTNSAGEVLASVIILTLLYGVLAVIEGGLMFKFARAGLDAEEPADPADGDQEPLVGPRLLVRE
jgi:cytochrome d ubiquinol oxidase subunit I